MFLFFVQTLVFKFNSDLSMHLILFLDLILICSFLSPFFSHIFGLFKLRNWSFSFTEVETFDMKDSRDEIDKEESDNSSIDINNITDVNLEEPNDEANKHHC